MGVDECRVQIGALIRSYGLTRYLPFVLKSYDWVDKIVVMNCRFKGVKDFKDNTPEIAKDKAVVIQKDWLNQHEVLNTGLDEFKGFDYIFIADNDELLTKIDQQRILEEAKGHNAACCNVLDYARDFNHIFPMRGHRPVVLVNSDVRFYDVRCSMGGHKFVNVFLHHFGYVHPKEDLDWKFDWEKPWEHDETIRIFSQIPKLYEMPEEIREMLCVD